MTAGRTAEYVLIGDEGGRARFRSCPDWGSTVYWDGSGGEGFVAIAVGAFADPGFPPPPFAIYALRRKRARLAGEIPAAQNALARQREKLAILGRVDKFSPLYVLSTGFVLFGEKNLCLLAFGVQPEPKGHPMSTPDTTEKLFCGHRYVADRFGISRPTLYRLAGRGLVKAKKSGRRTLWDVRSIEDYIDSLPAAEIGRSRSA